MLLLWCVLATSCFTRVSLNPLITTEKTSTTWPTNDSLPQIYSAEYEDSNDDDQNTTKLREIWRDGFVRLVDHIMMSIMDSREDVHVNNQTLILATMPNETDPNYEPREQERTNQVYHNISFQYQEGPDGRIQHSKGINIEERWDLPYILLQKLKNRESETSKNIAKITISINNETEFEITQNPEFKRMEMNDQSLNPLITNEKTSTTWQTNDSLSQLHSAEKEDGNFSDDQNTTEFREIWHDGFIRLVDYIMMSIAESREDAHVNNQTLILATMPNETDPNYEPREQERTNQVYHNISFQYQEGPDGRIQHSKGINIEERWDLPYILLLKLKNRESETSKNIANAKISISNETEFETTQNPEFKQMEINNNSELVNSMHK